LVCLVVDALLIRNWLLRIFILTERGFFNPPSIKRGQECQRFFDRKDNCR
jgi:hypothetical protein